jgi:hypothetical protein
MLVKFNMIMRCSSRYYSAWLSPQESQIQYIIIIIIIIIIYTYETVQISRHLGSDRLACSVTAMC